MLRFGLPETTISIAKMHIWQSKTSNFRSTSIDWAIDSIVFGNRITILHIEATAESVYPTELTVARMNI